MYSSSYQVPAVNINQSISPKAHFLGCFGMGTFIQSTSPKVRFLEAAPSSGLNHVCMILVALFSFQRTPSLILLPQYFVASSSPSVNVLICVRLGQVRRCALSCDKISSRFMLPSKAIAP